MSDRLLVLVRHGQSEWNLKNLFTGWKDPDLTELGVTEAKAAGRRLKEQNLTFDRAFTSDLKRAQRTLDLALGEMGQTGLPITRHQALNERDYGELSGLNKDDARAKWGEEQVHIWRRSFDVPPPGGESYASVTIRMRDWYDSLLQDTVAVSHGGSMRALLVALDVDTPVGAADLTVEQGVVYVFAGGQVTKHS